MDDSLVLLSTMSPKITKNMKPMRRKFPTKLATKKHFRRSSILEQHRKSIVNESVITISSSSSSSASYCESEAEAAVAAPAPHPVPHPAPHPVPHPAPSKIATAEVAATSHPVPAPASRRIPISRPVTAPHTVPAPVPPKIVSRTTVVVIPDSESDDDQQDESDEAMAAAAQLRLEYLRKLEATTPPRRTSAKYADIEQWVEQVNQITTTTTGKKSVAFSEVSTVYGDETNPNFRQPHTLVAASSTTVFDRSPRFDQLFKRKPTSRAKQLVEQSKGPSTETASYEPAEGILKGHLVQDSYQLNKGRAREFEMSTTSDTLTGTFTSSVHKIASDNKAGNIEKCPGKRKLKELNLSDEYLRDSFAQMQIRNSLELLNNRNRAGNVDASFETHNDVISDSFEENNGQLPISSGIQHNSPTNKKQPAVEVGDVNTENKENICSNSDVISDSQSLKPKKNTKRLLTANDLSKISIDLLTFRSTTINESRSTDSAHKPPESVDIVSDSESLRLKREYYCPNIDDSTVSIELLTPKNLTLQLSSKTVQRKVGLRDPRPQLRTGQRQNSGEVSRNSDAVISDSLSARLMKYAEANDDHDDVTPVSTNFLNLHESIVSPADPKKTTFSDSFQKLDGNSPSPETDNRDPQKTTFSDSFQKTEVDSPDIISNSESPRLLPQANQRSNNKKEPDLGDLDPSFYTFRSSTATSNIVRETDLADKTTRSYIVTGDSETPPKSDSFKESSELRTLKTGGAKTSANSKFPQNRPEKDNDNDSDATNVSVDFLNLHKLSVSPASPKKTTFSDSFRKTEDDSPDIISNSESPQVLIDILANHRRSDSNFADRTTKTNIITGNSEQLTTTQSNGNNESSQSSKAKGSKTKTNSGKSKKLVNGKLTKNTGLSSNPAEIQQNFADLDPSQYTFRSSTTTSNSDGVNFAQKTTRSNIITGTGELSTLTRENSDSCQKSRESSDLPTFKTNSATKSKSTKKNSNTESSSLVGSADVISDSQPSDRNANLPRFPTRKKQNPPNNEETDNNKKSAITKNDSASGDDIFQNIRSNLQSGFVKMTNQFITADSFDESFNLQLEDSLSNGLQTKQGSSSKNNDNSEVGQKDSSDREFKTPDNATSEAEMEHLLDSLYGKSWRENRENILPASEPRLKTSARGKTKTDAPNTERKPKPSLTHKNPYLITERNKTNSLRKIIHKARVNQALESPWVRSLKNICDSDTSSSDSDDTGPSGGRIRDDSDSDDINNDIDNNNDAVARQPVPRVKLTFDIEDDDSQQDQNLRDDDNDDDGSSKGTSGTRTVTATPCISEFPSSEENPPQLTISSTQTNTEDVNFQATDLKTKVTTTTTIDNGKVQKKVVKGTTPKKGTPKRGKGGRGPLKAIHEINTRLRTPKKETGSDDDDWYPIDDGKQKTKAVGSRRTRSKSKLGPLQRNGTYSFLASLSGRVPDSQCDPSARIFLANFKHYRDPLTQKLFKLYNDKVFANAIPQDTPLVWNDRMRRTAGFCYCRKITRRTGAVERKARIALSTKVLDSADRLCNTLIHEMCHAATWIVDGVTDQHGPVWRGWADRAMKTFPELPPIKRCHEYVINTKYTYRCVDCGYSIGRHSKSLDVDRKRCGHCMGKFELLINKVTKHGEAKSVPVTPKRQATGFALFVKENYANHKTPDLKHGDIMRILGQKFSAMKVSQT